MQESGLLRIVPHAFIRYKLLNSLFLGLSVGAVFTLYKPLPPSLFSIGGIVLALGMLLVAQLYRYIVTVRWFFRISLFVEFVLLAAMLFFLWRAYDYMSALVLYIAYQSTFLFGNYLLRAETLFLFYSTLLSKLDSAKQIGYLVGMLLSYLFYKVLEYKGVDEAQMQVYDLHWLLVATEIAIIVQLWRSFTTKPTQKA